MTDLIVASFRLGFLLLLWLFVLFAVFSIRGDMFGIKNKFPSKVISKQNNDPAIKIGKNEPTVLAVASGDLKGSNIPLVRGQVLKIGRDPSANIVIDDQYTSNDHAEIYDENGNWYLQDIGSTNGTYLNGEKIDTESIKKNEQIQIGKTIFNVE